MQANNMTSAEVAAKQTACQKLESHLRAKVGNRKRTADGPRTPDSFVSSEFDTASGNHQLKGSLLTQVNTAPLEHASSRRAMKAANPEQAAAMSERLPFQGEPISIADRAIKSIMLQN